MDRKVIGMMILANVLEMSIDKYLNYVDEFITATADNCFYEMRHIDERILDRNPKGAYGTVVKEGNALRFYAPEYIKFDFHLLREPDDIRQKHQMNWIRTKNLFLHHIMTNILTLQRDFWETWDRKTMVPISIKEFLRKCPLPHLDTSRLSRLLNNTWVSSNGQKYLLKSLFWSRKKVNAAILEYVINQMPCRMNDGQVQTILRHDHGINVSTRTICNYRISLGIPAHNRKYLSNPYSNFFSTSTVLDRKSLSMIPRTAGVYEMSIDKEIRYPKLASRIIYCGCSRNLRSRIQSYLCANIRNSIIGNYLKCRQLFIRYFVTPKYISVEKELLQRFFDKSGSLPIANKIGRTGKC